MHNSRDFIVVIAIFVFSSLLAASPQNSSRPAKPAAASPAPKRVATAATPKDPFIGVWKLNPAKSKYEPRKAGRRCRASSARLAE